MTVYLPVWHQCTRVRFTVLVSCNDEIAVHSCPLLRLQSKAAEPVLKFQAAAPGISIFWLRFRHLEAFDSGSRTIWSKKHKKTLYYLCKSLVPQTISVEPEPKLEVPAPPSPTSPPQPWCRGRLWLAR